MPSTEGPQATLEERIRWHEASRRGEGHQVSEYDFGRTVKSKSSATLYEATNREKLKQERALTDSKICTRDSEDNFVCDGDVFANNTG